MVSCQTCATHCGGKALMYALTVLLAHFSHLYVFLFNCCDGLLFFGRDYSAGLVGRTTEAWPVTCC